jgi:ATP-dependent Zn protease
LESSSCSSFGRRKRRSKSIPYSEFLNNLKGGKIAQVQVSGDYIAGNWKQPVNGKTALVTTRCIGALAYTIQRPTEDRFFMTREELDNRMAVLLGGRAAEWIVFSDLSTGAADDLAKVTDIARDMVMRFGMEKTLGPVSYESSRSPFMNDRRLLRAGTSVALATRPRTPSTKPCSISSKPPSIGPSTF